MTKNKLGLFSHKSDIRYPCIISKSINWNVLYATINNKEEVGIDVLFYSGNKSCSDLLHLPCPILFKASKAKTIYQLIELHASIYTKITPSHAFYLGTEFMKAELALIMQHSYTQN